MEINLENRPGIPAIPGQFGWEQELWGDGWGEEEEEGKGGSIGFPLY